MSTATLASELTPDQRKVLRRRTLATLAVGQVVASAAVTSSVTVAALVGEDLLGSPTWAGIAPASFTFGVATAAFWISRYMSRRGRRPGLRLGYLLGAAGALVAFFGVQQRLLVVFLFGLALMGAGQASNLQARFAAADLARPERRATYISMLVWIGTLGGVTGPLLVGAAKNISLDRGYEELAGPFLFGTVFFAAAALLVTLLLRPDPLVVSGGLGAPGKKFPPLRESLAVIWSKRSSQLALLSMVVSQGVMVAVMTMTPSHMKEHGHDVALVGAVFSVHIAGMYAFAPVVGWASDRLGRIPAIVVGSAILVLATILSALAAGRTVFLFPALLLLGLGWNFGLIAGSALLTESVEVERRVSVQGSADMLMSICGGVGGLGSGLVKSMFGYHILSNMGMVAALAVLGAALLHRRYGSDASLPAGAAAG